MSPSQILYLLLAVSTALHVATATCLLARRAGAAVPNALLTGASAAATILGLYFGALAAYP